MDLSVLNNSLLEFSPISLKEMDDVKLMNRADTKYVFNVSHLHSVLDKLKHYYRILEINDKRISNYETLYLDTVTKDLYLKHQNGKLNRHKVRFRKYIDSDLLFLEIKYKNNKGKTIKERIKQKEINFDFVGKPADFIKKHSGITATKLLPSLWVNFSRMTFVHKHRKERLTIDINLTYVNNDLKKTINSLIIAELKQEKQTVASEFSGIMKSERIYPNSFSKYSIGTVLLDKNIKHNRFKPRLLTLNKILKNNGNS